MHRYNPASVGQPVKLALELDPKLIDSTVTEAMMADEYRFASLQRSAPDPAKLPQASMTEDNATCHEARRRQPMTARAGEPKFLVIVATAGQGNLPEAAVKCWDGWSRS